MPKYVALISPFDLSVWIAFVVGLFFISITFWLVANAEGNIKDAYFHEWAVFKDSCWYCFGTLIGEAITRDTRTMHAPAVRQGTIVDIP